MVNLVINGKSIQVEENTTILNAAKALKIKIPTLCYLEGVNDIGSCRMCMVEVEGYPSLVAACNTKVREGMVIFTESDEISKSRQMMLKLILAKHRIHCFSCEKNGSCELINLCRDYGVDTTPFEEENKGKEGVIIDSNPFLQYDETLCIHCQRCVGACANRAGRYAIVTVRNGRENAIAAPFGKDWKESLCESCGNCANACPTGALISKNRSKYRIWQTKKVLTTCPHCATGCQYYLIVKDNEIVDVEPFDGPSNHNRLCVKGRFGSFDFVHSSERLKYPLIKNKETGEFERASWDEALDLVASKFMELKKKYGSESLAGFACSRSPNEDIYMLQKMVRTCFETNNVDNCARVCHSASVAGLAMTLGSGAMTNPIYDITNDVDCIMLVGSNPEEAHPVVGMQIRKAVDRGTRLIVVDPRDIGLSKKADIHLKIKPGTNVAFANGMMHVIIKEGLADEEFIKTRTEGFEKLREIVEEYTPQKVSQICHIKEDMLIEAAKMYAKAKKAPIIYCLGVTEHSTGTEGVMSMSNMAMMVGKLGKEGCGVNPLRGQNNVQGACDMGALPGDFPGYQKLKNKEVLEKFEKAWNKKLNPNEGLHATEVFPASIEGKIKGLFIFGEDPVVTDPDTNHVIKALESLEFLVVDDLFMTETAKYADVILPGVSYAEKEGTFSNTERRVQRVRKAVTLEGEMRLDTDIFIDLMNRMGYEQPYLTSAEIMDEIASLTPSFAGISHERLDKTEGIQWPCTSKEHPGTPIMHVGKFTRGLGWFYPAKYVESSELPDEDYPILMMTGRVLYHYNTRAMTGKTPGLMEISGSSFIEMNTQDAAELGVKDGDKVKVSSRRGEIITTARVSEKVSKGESWMPFHFPDGNANWLTNAALDEYAKIPEYKVCAVKINSYKE
ncbi:formate dehydrogenase major subunit [Acetitomaculum ruminis DSM 5522]|uniref:Formate dehydrogenase major subunit n=1 Tax=Acetitomaculum ruminis DSM 5522 TaxID=1120918 RepID=A0A1I0YAT7_9FIRM|nr:formate dehydrogenase subunit alpha [Acetitomaculum ruminis]SFB10449.1 formate dehydrogenase major subunit [Acetitomaculum ruminis DSM 5522]